jgi:hypothetical protein
VSATWEGLGAVPAPIVWPRARPGMPRPPKGEATWVIQSADASPPWMIRASHRPNIDTDHGPDAWRIAVTQMDALATVEWLVAEAAKGGA